MNESFVLKLARSNVFYKQTSDNDSFTLTPFPDRAVRFGHEKYAHKAAEIYSKQWGLDFIVEIYVPFL